MSMDRIIEDKRWIKPKHYKFIAGGVLLLAVLLFVMFRNPVSTFVTDKEKATISTVALGEFNDYISVTGQVVPISTIYLDAIEGGLVEDIVRDEGSMLKQGDVILRLHNNDLNLSIMNSESSLAYHTNELRNTQIQMEQQKIQNKRELLQIDYELNRLKRMFEQNESLYNDGLIAKEDYIRSQEDYEKTRQNRDLIYLKLVQDSIFRENQKNQMDENLGNMRMNQHMVRQRLDNLNIKSPVDGQLGYLDAELGQSINKGQRIGQINVLTSFKIEAQIDEHYIDRVRVGLPAYFERNTDTFGLKIKKVFPEVREGRFVVEMLFDEKLPDNIRIGQTYYVKLELGSPQTCVLLPRGGFFQSTGGRWVYVLDKEGHYAGRRNIKIGKYNPQFYEVVEGLEAGEQVITSSYELFGDNERIKFR
jgi:HlyD family secretion protein